MNSPIRLQRIGVSILVTMVSVTVAAPLIARHDPNATTGLPFETPSRSHPLGTTDIGQDIFSQVLHGGRISLFIAFGAASLATSVGLLVGLVSGYRRGWRDAVLMRFVDLMLCFPFLAFVIVVSAFFGRGLITTMLVISMVLWARPARVLRAQVVKVSEYGHVAAARAMGGSDLHVLRRHVVPRVVPMVVSQFVRAANVSVVLESSLAFLGLGNPNRMSWGTILYFANNQSAMLTGAWKWWILPPGLMLSVAIVGLAFVGFGIESRVDPRLINVVRRPAKLRAGQRGGDNAVVSRAARVHSVAPDVPKDSALTAALDSALDSALDIDGVSIEYATAHGPLRAVDGVTLRVPRATIVGLVGESGCGKTTLAMTAAGMLRAPASLVDGQIRIDGRSFISSDQLVDDTMRGRRVAYVPQFAMNALNPAYTIHRQVSEAAELTMDADHAQRCASEALEGVGLASERHRAYPHELSGGMRQRAVIAMAVVNSPALLIADEPLTGLDVTTQLGVLHLLRKLCSELEVAVLLISHDLAAVRSISDIVATMYAGRIVDIGDVMAVGGPSSHPYTQALLRSLGTFDDGLDTGRRSGDGPDGGIAGEPPDLLCLPVGCAFGPRCREATSVCELVRPKLEPIVVEGVATSAEFFGHRVACAHRATAGGIR